MNATSRVSPGNISRHLLAPGMFFLLTSCCCTPPPGPSARALDGSCVVHADGFSPENIHINNRVFVATRTAGDHPENGSFAGFNPVTPPTGNPAIHATVNADGQQSIFALSESWFRGVSFNEALRAQEVRSPRLDGNGVPLDDPPDIGMNSQWLLNDQDFTGSWSGVAVRTELVSPRLGANAPDAFVVETDPHNSDEMPQWLFTGVTDKHMFMCAGGRTEDGRDPTIWLYEVTPRGSQLSAPGAFQIQDVLNGDSRFTVSHQNVGLGGLPNGTGTNPGAPPMPQIAGPAGASVSGVDVHCAMTQTQDDVSTRVLHLLTIQGNLLLHATLSNFGPVTQTTINGSTRTFNRFRTASAWEDVTGLWPAINFGSLQHVATVASGHDGLTHVFLVGNTNTANGPRNKLWHLERTGDGHWFQPVDVLAASGDAPQGTPYDMPVSAAICPLYGQANTLADLDAEVIITFAIPLTRSVIVQEVSRSMKQWVPSRAPSNYSPWEPIPTTGVPSSFTLFRSRVSMRPFAAN